MNEHSQTSRTPRLLDRVSDAIRLRHYSYRIEQAYVSWLHPVIPLHGKRHPQTIGAGEIRECFTHLAVHRHITPLTQNQARSALLFLYRQVLSSDLDRGGPAVRSPLDVQEKRASCAG